MRIAINLRRFNPRKGSQSCPDARVRPLGLVPINLVAEQPFRVMRDPAAWASLPETEKARPDLFRIRTDRFCRHGQPKRAAPTERP